MVESERGSISWVVSHGNRVPSPTRLVQAQSLSQSTVRSNSSRTSGGTNDMSRIWSLTCFFHAGSLYFKNHWSCRILTLTLLPQRQMTGRVSNSYIIFESYFSIISAATSSRATRTGFPPYLSNSFPLENSAEY